MREGDLDHLVYYILQSTMFTRLPPIEPAVSAAAFVKANAVPRSAQARIHAFASAIEKSESNARLQYFHEILDRERPDKQALRAFLSERYGRAMRFLYEKEFGSANPAVYQGRGLSTDTSVDAGYVVYLALATLKHLEPERRVDRVLIVGPGLDLAPRTGLVDTSAPQSYQSLAVIDALLGLGLTERTRLHVRAIDINPRVVDWIRSVRGKTPSLAVIAGVAESDRVRFTEDYRAYFAALGRFIGREHPMPGLASGYRGKSISLASGVTDAVDATLADITVERLHERYDLIVVTNVFPYLSDSDLLLAVANIAHMLAPGGVLLHNEPRPLLAEATLALNLPLTHARSAVIATVEGARSPLYDSIWMHRLPR